MIIPSHTSRTPEEIVGEKLYFDSAGYFYRAMSWLDHFEKNDQFPALLYTCIEARYGIEYLMFEELVISTGANLTIEEYEECLKNPTKLYNVFRRISPDYDRLQGFAKIIVSLAPGFPKMIQWNLKKLLKSWSTISNYLHWCGSKNNTTELKEWRDNAGVKVRNAVEPIWLNITSGKSGMMHPKDMHPEIHELWQQYKDNKVDAEGIKIRMAILKPMLESKDA